MFQGRCNEFFIGIFLILVSVEGFEQICSNISQIDSSLSIIESFRFNEGFSQPKDSSCFWFLPLKSKGFYQISLRTVVFQDDIQTSSNELIFRTNNVETIYNNENQRFWRFSALKPLEIEFRSKNVSNRWKTLNIRRFRLELIYTENDEEQTNRCAANKYVLPIQWKCNCQYECMTSADHFDISDETNCSICSIIQSVEDFFCRSNEFFCLPQKNSSQNEPISGVCLNQQEQTKCLVSSRSLNCEKIWIFSENSSQKTVFESMLKSNEILCFVIMPKQRRQIELFINEIVDLDLFIYDGDRFVNPNFPPNYFRFDQYFIQNNLAIISMRRKTRRLILLETNRNEILLNISWATNICPENQTQCNGLNEQKCYTKEQRCDGVWDCIGGDDEISCSPQSCPNKFSCNDRLRLPSDIARCYTREERCNGFAYCPNRMDERFCSSWWCNSQNGTFLCQNRNCIYEVWRCDGQDDCGDNSDERNCPAQIPRRIMTSIVIGVTVCSILFVVALACSCKLYHLRLIERRASIRLINPTNFVQRSSSSSNETRRMAPPSYNQTMGLVDENEERYALLSENLRLAGLADMITIAPVDSYSHSRRSRRSRRHRTQDAESNNNSGRFVRQFDLFRSLFTNSNDRSQSNEFEISEHAIATLRELPPDYVADPSSITNLTSINGELSDSIAQADDSTLSLRNQPKPRSTRLITVNNDDNDDEPLSPNSDDDKLLIP